MISKFHSRYDMKSSLQQKKFFALVSRQYFQYRLRSSRSELFYKISVLKNFLKFTRKHLIQYQLLQGAEYNMKKNFKLSYCVVQSGQLPVMHFMSQVYFYIWFSNVFSQPAITCSKLTIKLQLPKRLSWTLIILFLFCFVFLFLINCFYFCL